MAQIELENITKRYGEKTALDHISLCVRDNEFFVLFGPAGAGKTTLLKTIAGIEFPQEGLVKINGKTVNQVEPMNRNVSMVFENYALYPQLSVYDNIAFPMRSRLYKKDEAYIKSAVDRVTKMLNISNLLDRRPVQLSNGQRQRVAIGRCLVREPNVFLMDEPLAHLDAKLRHFMREELKEMQSSFNTTTIYVTHDYMEAMSLADRIAVLNNGKFEQTGTAHEMYYEPANEFVAKLFGEPEINLFPAEPYEEDGVLKLRAFSKDTSLIPRGDVSAALRENGGKTVDVGIRGADIDFSFENRGDGWVRGSVYACEPIGNKVIVTVTVAETQVRVVAPNSTKAELDSDIYLRFHTEDLLYFDEMTKESIGRSGGKRPAEKTKQAEGVVETWHS